MLIQLLTFALHWAATAVLPALGQQQPTLGLGNGFTTLHASDIVAQLVDDSQTLYSLSTPSPGNFNFVPTDVMVDRQYDGNYHLGDITFRVRPLGASAWSAADSSQARRKVIALPVSGDTLAAADLSPTLPSDSLLNVTRRWVSEGGQLEMLFDLTNAHSTAVEIGALGAPLEFNNIFTGRTAAQTNELCSLFDPYIGQDAGYVQVTPLLGTLPPLVVLPAANTTSPLEGWRFLPENTSTSLAYQSQTFEALFEWQFHTLAYAENEWAAVQPWNAPTSAVLAPGETRTYGLQFRVASSIREIEDTVRAADRPLAVGIPGYILPADQTGKLFLSAPASVANISVDPAGSLAWVSNSDATNASWIGFDVKPQAWGRSRLTITYTNGMIQTVHYYLTRPATDVLATLGNFLTTEQWFENATDPFGRSPSVISYDRSVNDYVLNDQRAWIPGLEDEAGAGSWLAAAMKQYVQPNAAEVAKMERFINETLYGSIQNLNDTVKHSVFFYQPDLVPNYTYPSDIDWTIWWSWNQAASYATDRAYDYVHVTAAYWALYRVARNYPALVSAHDWTWYLDRAVATVASMTDGTVGYANDGLMGETVIRVLLDDLQREGRTDNASLVQSRMQARESIWAGERYPFGSEMAWDSTGQEGVYVWAKYFNDSTTATNVIDSIIAYQPTVAHWGYNGNARRYWDNVYGGKLMRIERQIHHYGSGLNALPLLSQFRSTPDDLYLLRVGYAGVSGPMSNVDEAGFAAASFHSWEDTLAWDAYSGDYGPNFVGHSLGMGTFLVEHPDFGWQAFGGLVTSISSTVSVEVQDSTRRRIFLAPIGALLTLDAGAFTSFTFDQQTKTVSLQIVAVVPGVDQAASALTARLTIQQTASVGGVGNLTPSMQLQMDAGAWSIPFSGGVANATLTV